MKKLYRELCDVDPSNVRTVITDGVGISVVEMNAVVVVVAVVVVDVVDVVFVVVVFVVAEIEIY
jgi:hypothetical protein